MFEYDLNTCDRISDMSNHWSPCVFSADQQSRGLRCIPLKVGIQTVMLVIYFPMLLMVFSLPQKSQITFSILFSAIQPKISTCGVSKMDDFPKQNIMEVYVQVQYVDVHTCILPMQGFDHS